MNKVIITLRDARNSFSYDLELPTDLKYENLIDDLVQTIISYNPSLMFQASRVRLIIPRINMTEMKNGETLEMLGVLNGDYLLIM